MLEKSTQICIRMSIELRQKLQEIADAEERSLAWVVNKACKEYIEKKNG